MAIYKTQLKLIYVRYFRGPPWIDYDLIFLIERHITRARTLPDIETVAEIKFNCYNKISHIGCIYIRECPSEFNCSKLVSSFRHR